MQMKAIYLPDNSFPWPRKTDLSYRLANGYYRNPVDS
jgi:hypothetical protein